MKEKDIPKGMKGLPSSTCLIAGCTAGYMLPDVLRNGHTSVAILGFLGALASIVLLSSIIITDQSAGHYSSNRSDRIFREIFYTGVFALAAVSYTALALHAY